MVVPFAGTVAEYDDALTVTRTGNAVVLANCTQPPTVTVTDDTVNFVTVFGVAAIVTTEQEAAAAGSSRVGLSAAAGPIVTASVARIPVLTASRLTGPWSLNRPSARW